MTRAAAIEWPSTSRGSAIHLRQPTTWPPRASRRRNVGRVRCGVYPLTAIVESLPVPAPARASPTWAESGC